MRHVTQPGPVAAERLEMAPALARPIEVTLGPGTLESAVASVLEQEDLDGAWLEISDAKVSALDYVIPATSPDEDHAAWYSDIHSLGGAGRIEHLGIMVGREDGQPSLHGHGLWARDGGKTAMGHILPGRAQLTKPVTARGLGLTGGCFERQACPETNFTLFRPAERASIPESPNCTLLRMSPNQDLAESLDEACARLGWQEASVHGIGSLIEARFADGRVLDSLPTEFLLLDADARADRQDRPGPDLAIVGVEGSEVMRGPLARGNNPILITGELILVRRD